MNPIEQFMVKRSSHFKLALGVVVLIPVLWVSGAAIQSLWITPAVILVLWIAIQFGLGYLRHRHSA